MSDGLQIRDSTGNLSLDISSYIYRLHGVYTVPLIAKRTQYTLSIPGYTVGMDWAIYLPRISYIRLTEQTGQLLFFNEDYYSSKGNFSLCVFKR